MTNDGNYQDTFCDWVGEIPKDWNMTRGRFLFNSKKEINRELQCENLLSLTLNGVLNKDYQSSEGLRPENYNTYQIFQKDDLVFKMIDLENIKTSRVGLVHEEGIMSPVYIRHEPIKEKINPKFAYWFYYDLYKKEIYNSIGSGVRSSLSSSDLLEIELPVPPIEEQKLISQYLDKKTSQIDSLVEKIQKKIELLKEQRTSLINHYVTKGLDPNVEMKDSGVERIGEIPKHYVTVKLRWIIDSIKDGTHGTHPSSDDGKILLSGKNVHDGFLNINDSERHIPLEEHEKIIKNGYPKEGDVLVSSVGSIGRSCVFEYPEPISFQRSVCFIRPSLKLNSYYLSYLIRSNVCQTQITTLINQSTVGGIYMGDLTNLSIITPPIEEQEKIVNFLDKKIGSINSLIEKVEMSKDLLNEYRQSLISSVVTGKVRVTEDMI